MAVRAVIAALFVALLSYPASVAGDTSQVGCSKLGLYPKEGSQFICSNAKVGNGSNECPKPKTGVRADHICEREGMRLCSLEELENKEGKNAGCGVNKELAWTNTECDGEDFWWAARGSNGNQKECLAKDDDSVTASVLCCADLEDPIFTFFIGVGYEETPDGLNTPFFEYFADPDGTIPFFANAQMFRGVVYRIMKIKDDTNYPLSLAKIVASGGITPLELPVYSNVPDKDGISLAGEWLQVTPPLGYEDPLFYHATTNLAMAHPFVVGTALYVTGPNAEPPYYNYFSDFNPLTPLSDEELSDAKTAKLLKGELYRINPLRADPPPLFRIQTAPLNDLFPIITGLPIAGEFQQFFVPPAYQGEIFLYDLAAPAAIYDQLEVVSEV
eukprot:CAMPEP_0117680728 /NCGR_PEP_ID=MMETSP0804-20121206/18532_1 /TAXON_ID=1074897 /ORGANISM="Tetraselmis astigmatica, Strain CCMP880" /LENGTH=385 /DNA_ID=CAMNT_0005490295 /DNA_START=75 /DNA_END=1232 /DNA_ORIENTATION=+